MTTSCQGKLLEPTPQLKYAGGRKYDTVPGPFETKYFPNNGTGKLDTEQLHPNYF